MRVDGREHEGGDGQAVGDVGDEFADEGDRVGEDHDVGEFFPGHTACFLARVTRGECALEFERWFFNARHQIELKHDP